MEFPKQFQSLVDAGNPTGEVIAVNRFLVKVRGLSPININALVMFSDSSKGVVKEIRDNHVLVLSLNPEPLSVGTLVVAQHPELVTRVGDGFLGRVVDVTGKPLDGKGAIAANTVKAVFSDAPPLMKRKQLETQLPTGVVVVDTLFPIALGQRIAVLGDHKSGKSAFVGQIGTSQKGTDRVVVYAMVGKKQTEIDDLIRLLESSGVMQHCVIVASSIFDSLVDSYLVPYVACAMAEYFWLDRQTDTVVIYDDLTAHAQVHREISLLANVSPGRDSFPGDTFFVHSSLLERAGRIAETGKSLTAIPVVLVPGGDVTAYLPTNIMSITDGQLIFDLDLMHEGIRPAINTGLSVSRVGGRVQSKIHKGLATQIFKLLSSYHQAEEFSHFGSELALESQNDLTMGRRLLESMKQKPGQNFTPMSQQIFLDALISTDPQVTIDIPKLREEANAHAPQVVDDESHKAAVQAIVKTASIEVKR